MDPTFEGFFHQVL